MKQIIVRCLVMLLLPAAVLVGCKHDNSNPTGPSAPTATPTKTGTRTPSVTNSATATPTVSMTRTATSTPTNSPTPTQSPTMTLSATPQAPQAMVLLGSALNYVGLAYSAITNSGPTTFCGGLGLYPGSSVDGGIVVTCGGANDVANTSANTAKLDLGTAYTDAAGRTGGAPLGSGADIGGLTLHPGLYNAGGNLFISSADLTLDALGDVNAVFIFQVNGALDVTTGRQVLLIGGAKAANVFWQVTDYCSLGTTVSMVGNILAYNSVTLNTGAVLLGRAFGSNGNVTLLSNTITQPTP